jgi:hypothetical protein
MTTSVSLPLIIRNKAEPLDIDLTNSDSMLTIGLVTESCFYTMLEAGMALIAVNLPSLRVFSFSLLPGEILRSMRSFLSLSRSSSAASEAPSISDTNEPQKPGSFSTCPSNRSHVQHQDQPWTSVSAIEDPEGQNWIV